MIITIDTQKDDSKTMMAASELLKKLAGDKTDDSYDALGGDNDLFRSFNRRDDETPKQPPPDVSLY